MKNSTKMILAGSLCLLIMGSIFFVIGMLLGGTPSFRLNNRGVELDKSNKVFSLEKTKIDKFSKADLDIEYADVSFVESDDYYIEYYYNSDSEPDYKVENGKLSFRDSNKAGVGVYNFDISFFSYKSAENKVVVYIPKAAYFDDVLIKVASGDVNVEGMNTAMLTLKNSFGDIEMVQIAADTANIELSSGKLTVNGLDSKEYTIKNSFGNVSLDGVNTNSLFTDTYGEIELSSGNLEINKLFTDTLKIENSYGNIAMKDIDTKELTGDLSSGDFLINNGSLKNAVIDSEFGDIELNLKGNEKEYALDLETSFGDITRNDYQEGDSYNNHNDSTDAISVSAGSGDIELNFKP